MIKVVVISILTCLATLLLTLIKPSVKIKNKQIAIYYLPTVVGAIVLLLTKNITLQYAFDGLVGSTDMSPIKILLLFFSMTFISVFLDETGFFNFLAIKVVNKFKGSQKKLFCCFFVFVSILTLFTSNDVIILTFTPFYCYFAKIAKINPIPYLVSEFVAANTASMFFIFGNPTNIYLASSANIDFLQYFIIMALPTFASLFVVFSVMYLCFNKSLKQEIVLDENIEVVKIKSKFKLIFTLIILLLTIVLMAISSYISFSIWLVSASAMFVLIFVVLLFDASKKQRPREIGKTFLRLPYELIPFILGMFILVLSLNKTGVTQKIYEFFSNTNEVFGYGAFSTIVANFINNIPMSVLFSSVLSFSNSSASIFASIIGSNIGAYITPFGALAGIMWLKILKDNNVNFKFISFIKYGLIVGVPALFASLGVLALMI